MKSSGRTQPKKYIPKTPPTTTTPLSNSLRQSTSSVEGGGSFVNYLPQDEAVAAGLREGGSDPVESQRVVDLLNRHLSTLLKLTPRHFWSQVASDSSLHGFLESFLQFRSRWYDFPYRGVRGIVAGVIVGEIELSKRVFMVLYRLSSNRDPGARAADSLSPKDHTVLLQEKKLLDMPKLFDICAIYGHENEDLTKSLVVNALKAQPWIQEDITSALSHFLNIVHTMHQRCSASLEVLVSSLGNGAHGSSRLHEDYLEVMDFINDAIVSMDAFVSAYKPAAVVFSCPVEMSSGNEDLLNTLARLHDSLLPSLLRGFRVIFTSEEGGVQEKNREMLSNIIRSLKMLSIRIADFGWKLLDICYLSDEEFDGEFPLPNFTKMFPAKVEDPGIRADILVQTFREICGGYSHVEEGFEKGTFLQKVEKDHKILERIQLLQETGWVVLDDEQIRYFTGIMKLPWETNTQMPNAPTTSASDKLEDTAILDSKISQIKDIFPDYGNSFLSACLEVYNYNPEEVVQHILEGNLHPDLQLLDPTQETILPPKSSSVSKNDKGKGKLVESLPPPLTSMVPKSRNQQSHTPSISTSSSMGRYVRKSTVLSPDSVTLDCRDKRDLTKTSALISQFEYDDEYDDSFDDLGLGVPDSGLEERESAVNSAPIDSTKWGSRNKPQFFVKDGKNYSYKVKDSVAVANYNEADIVNQAQKELIHGLGRGGNIPLGAVRKLTESNLERDDEGDGDDVAESGGQGAPGNFRGRGRRGGGGGRSNHYRKDRAMKKHFTGVSGF